MNFQSTVKYIHLSDGSTVNHYEFYSFIHFECIHGEWLREILNSSNYHFSLLRTHVYQSRFLGQYSCYLYLGEAIVLVETIGEDRSVGMIDRCRPRLMTRVKLDGSQIVAICDQRRWVMEQKKGFCSLSNILGFIWQVLHNFFEIVTDKSDFN